jgi:hypothetical protein
VPDRRLAGEQLTSQSTGKQLMNNERNTDRTAIKIEINRLHQLENKVDSGIGHGITRRIRELEKKLDAGRKNDRAA